MYILYAILSALSNSSDVILGKLTLEKMPITIFIFILSFLYIIIGLLLYIYKSNEINKYLSNSNNYVSLLYSILAISIGTILADFLVWHSINLSNRKDLPITMSIIHLSPIFSLILVYLFYGERLHYKSILGIIISVIGCGIAIYYSNTNIKVLLKN